MSPFPDSSSQLWCMTSGIETVGAGLFRRFAACG